MDVEVSYEVLLRHNMEVLSSSKEGPIVPTGTVINPFKTDKTAAYSNLGQCLSGNHKQSVTRTYHQDESWKVRRARQALDLRHSRPAPSQF